MSLRHCRNQKNVLFKKYLEKIMFTSVGEKEITRAIIDEYYAHLYEAVESDV